MSLGIGQAASNEGERPTAQAQPGLNSTLDLDQRAKAGERDRLFACHLPALGRWASGRLPRWTRDLMDTDDLVQETVIRALKRIDSFEPRHEGALHAYLRQAILNRIRDEVRRAMRLPVVTELDETSLNKPRPPSTKQLAARPLTGTKRQWHRVRPEKREAIVVRVEMDGSYQQVAQALGNPSADAARMAVSRVLLRLAREIDRVA
jgi:RNA polymerase sigma-70 factor (ECF subfamily)